MASTNRKQRRQGPVVVMIVQ